LVLVVVILIVVGVNAKKKTATPPPVPPGCSVTHPTYPDQQSTDCVALPNKTVSVANATVAATWTRQRGSLGGSDICAVNNGCAIFGNPSPGTTAAQFGWSVRGRADGLFRSAWQSSALPPWWPSPVAFPPFGWRPRSWRSGSRHRDALTRPIQQAERPTPLP